MIAQIFIAILGVSAIWMSQSKEFAVRRWAPVLGLAGQPFWFWAAYSGEQWGIFALCFFYSVAWAKGLWNYWGPKTA